jgi:hypothetical protein
MLGDLQQIDDACEARSSRQIGRDVGQRDLEQLRHDDMAGREWIPTANLHMRSLPQANRAGDLAIPDSVSQRCKELHAHSTVNSVTMPCLKCGRPSALAGTSQTMKYRPGASGRERHGRIFRTGERQ